MTSPSAIRVLRQTSWSISASSVRKGQTLAVIGATGSGKTTLASAHPSFLRRDGRRRFLWTAWMCVSTRFDALYDKLGYVTQKAVLFSGTVERQRLLRAECAQKRRMRRCRLRFPCRRLRNSWTNTPEKAAHPIAQLGRNVSGGQKQRLSIARALARKPEILIFDDSFSALDYKTDAVLREGLAKQLPGTTKIIVAQRISTIRNADQILVLDRGEIAGLGTHDELMVSCPVYREIAMSQLSEEELKKGGVSK